MVRINESVGTNGHNSILDVKVVQRLINQNLHLLLHLTRLPEDGVITHHLITAITEFQRRVLRIPAPNGRVDPTGTTLHRGLVD